MHVVYLDVVYVHVVYLGVVYLSGTYPVYPHTHHTHTYHTCTGSVKYLWPLTLPITDGGAQKKRLDAIRRQLDWRLVGCELIECYGS